MPFSTPALRCLRLFLNRFFFVFPTEVYNAIAAIPGKGFSSKNLETWTVTWFSKRTGRKPGPDGKARVPKLPWVFAAEINNAMEIF